MSYQVLARKWRPNQFSELVGQEHVVNAISNALANNRLHHAYLFSGTRGVGKTTIARIFSKSLNCEQGMSATPCGQCHTCKDIEQGNYVDLLEIDAASRTKVEDTRELLDNVQYKPTRGQFKVYLIDEVHMLSKHSFNALLKTLEEPPPHVKFLLATTDPQKLPVTILSRCLQFNLKALSSEQIIAQLEHILTEEKIAFDTGALNLLARAAQGSMRDALSLTDQAIAQSNGQVFAPVVTDMLGLMDKNQVLKLVHCIFTNQVSELLAQIEHIASQAPDYSQLLSEIMSLLHQVALTQFVPEACKLETLSAKAVYKLAKMLPPEQVQLCYQIALQGRKDITHAADGRSGLEMTLLRMLAFNPSPISLDVDELKQLAKEQQSAAKQNLSASSADTEPSQPSKVDPEIESNTVEPQHGHSQTEQTIDSDVAQSESVGSISSRLIESEAQDPPNKESSNNEMVEKLNSQQQDILRQADVLKPPVNNLQTSSADDFDMQNDAYFQQQETDDYHYNSENEGSHIPISSEVTQAEIQQANNTGASPSSTASLIALKERLDSQLSIKGDGDTEVKKSKPEVSTSDLIRNLEANTTNTIGSEGETSAQISESDSSVSANGNNALLPVSANCNVEQAVINSEPKEIGAEHGVKNLEGGEHTLVSQQAQGTPFNADPASSAQDEKQIGEEVDVVVESHSDEVDSAPPWPFDIDEQQLTNRGEPVSEEPFDPTAHLEEEIDVEVDFDVPAFLDDGEKVTAAKQLDTWSQLIEQMEVTALTKQLALHSSYEKQGNQVTLNLLDSKPHLDTESARDQLQRALSKALQQQIRLQVNHTKPVSTPFAVQQTINQVRMEHAKKVVETDENIGRLMQVFAAKVVPDTIKPR